MSSRLLLVAAAMIGLSIAACSGATPSLPRSAPAVTATTTPTAALTSSPIVLATRQPTADDHIPSFAPSPVDMVPISEITFPPGLDLAKIVTVCSGDVAKPSFGRDCETTLAAVLSSLAGRATNVTRMAWGDLPGRYPCGCDVMVGFSDGRLEGFRIDQDRGSLKVLDPFSLDPDCWPWGSTASFTSPKSARPNIGDGPGGVLKNRTPLPFCGDSTPFEPDAPDPRPCFGESVLSGRPAEMIYENPGYEGGWFVSVYRFTGTGAIKSYDSGQVKEHNWATEWTASTTPLIIDADGTFSVY